MSIDERELALLIDSLRAERKVNIGRVATLEVSLPKAESAFDLKKVTQSLVDLSELVFSISALESDVRVKMLEMKGLLREVKRVSGQYIALKPYVNEIQALYEDFDELKQILNSRMYAVRDVVGAMKSVRSSLAQFTVPE